MTIYMDTPVGKMPIPDSITQEYENMTADEVWELLKQEEKRTGFIDPWLFGIWAHKNPVAYAILRSLKRKR